MAPDVTRILEKRHQHGADFWATDDGRIYKGSPFSTIQSLLMLHELEVSAGHEAVQGGLALLRQAVRDDGRIRLAPKAPLYPCYTAEAARVLCRWVGPQTVGSTIEYLLGDVHESGGWRCSFSRFGKGPETQVANPGATLFALDVLRFVPELREGRREVDEAVESLLRHWEVKEPTGPCHYGIGSLFMQVEFPFLRYNLFYWVYVLSFFGRARDDARFQEGLEAFREKLDREGRVVVENPHRSLKRMDFCARGEPSEVATRRWREAEANLAG